MPTLALPDPVRATLLADHRRILVLGARGWIGRCLLAMLHAALGEQQFAMRVRCFGSARGRVNLGGGRSVRQAPLPTLARLRAAPSMAFHLAFLTKDKVAGMPEADYVEINRRLSADVARGIVAAGVDRLFLASSGAAGFANDSTAAADLRLYGQLKREDEQRFADWAITEPERRLLSCRIFALSGPYINKPSTYALGSFIRAGLKGGPVVVTAPFPVVRSYVAVTDVLAAALAELLAANGPPVIEIDTGGTAMELGEVGAAVARHLGVAVQRMPLRAGVASVYAGNDVVWQAFLARHAITGQSLDEQIANTAAWLRNCK
jgi:nucleoside-diphosphate-sugar epimerase